VLPLIGIPPCLDDRGRWRAGRDYDYLDCAYARAVADAGGAPIYLPIQDDVDALTARLSGLLLPGGDDFLPPGDYPAQARFDPAPAARIDFDARLLESVTRRGLPVLAICYGMQLLARQHGGALHHDLATDLPGAGEHDLPEADGRHAVAVQPGTRLAEILGTSPPPVNSLHHQGVADPGPGLVVSARADDGVIEAVEGDGPPFRIGVQWHPEKLSGPHRERLFSAFVAACAGA
jgi:putative glutamine amidotransferase